jgi:hypothetical protein
MAAGSAPATVADEAPLVPVRGRGIASAVLAAGYLLAAILVTWRLWGDPASRIVAGNTDDADLFAWYMRYAATAVAHGSLPALVTHALNAPLGINAMWNPSMLLPCVALAPVTLLFGPQVSLTVITTIGFAGSAFAMYWVLRRWKVSGFAAGLAGAVYGFSPALLHAAIGHYELQFAVLPPLIIDAGLRLVVGRPGDSARPRGALVFPAHVRDGARLGLLVGLQLLISEELALTTAIAGLLLVIALALSWPRQVPRRLLAAAKGLAVAVACAVLIAGWALTVQFFGPLSQHGSPFLADYYVNDLTAFVTPSQYQLFHTAASAQAAAAYQGGAPEYLGYLGWPLILALAVAVVVFWRRPVIRALALAGAALATLSLGGFALISRTPHPGVLLPWHWIEELPLANSVLPARLSILIAGIAAALLAFSVDLAIRRLDGDPDRMAADRPGGRGRLVWALAALACLPLLPRPLPTATATPLPAGWSAAMTALHLPAGARILVVPVPQAHLTAAMRWQADSGRQESLIGGYFIGPAWDGHAYIDGNGLAPTAAYLNRLWVAELRPGSPAARAAALANLPPPGTPPPGPQVSTDLGYLRPAAVIAVTGPRSALARYLSGVLGAPTVHKGSILAWRLT